MIQNASDFYRLIKSKFPFQPTEKQDIVFVGGGNTKSMLAVWREWGLDKFLEDAYKKGTIMCGVSAGAICWFETNFRECVC